MRQNATAAKRTELIKAAAGLLRRRAGVAGFSLEAVGKIAGVTRLTVYNHFGSRRGLLKAVFADIAQRGGIERLREVADSETVEAGLERLVSIFCAFWGSDPAIEIVHNAIASDTEVAGALLQRFRRGRQAVEALVSRAMPRATLADRNDAVDLILVLTDFPAYRALSERRGSKAVCRLTIKACKAVLD